MKKQQLFLKSYCILILLSRVIGSRNFPTLRSLLNNIMKTFSKKKMSVMRRTCCCWHKGLTAGAFSPAMKCVCVAMSDDPTADDYLRRDLCPGFWNERLGEELKVVVEGSLEERSRKYWWQDACRFGGATPLVSCCPDAFFLPILKARRIKGCGHCGDQLPPHRAGCGCLFVCNECTQTRRSTRLEAKEGTMP